MCMAYVIHMTELSTCTKSACLSLTCSAQRNKVELLFLFLAVFFSCLATLLSSNDSWFRIQMLLVQVLILILLVLCLMLTQDFLSKHGFLRHSRACLPDIKPFVKKNVSNYLQQVLNSYFSRICAYKDTFTFSVLCLWPDSHTVAQVVLFFILPVAPLMPAKQLIGMFIGRRNNIFISENHFCAALGFKRKSFLSRCGNMSLVWVPATAAHQLRGGRVTSIKSELWNLWALCAARY